MSISDMAYEIGFTAYETEAESKGACKAINPYELETAKYKSWKLGYEDAEQFYKSYIERNEK